MDHKLYELWLTTRLEDPSLVQELITIKDDEAEISDRFYRNLEFGTGGLRGLIGAGTNRMNLYTVRKATQGLSDYLIKTFFNPSVCIAYDTRNKSREFALSAAQVLCANGIHVYLFDTVHPTPMLSFSVRHLKASAGIVITASHNPKEYNGYKVYGSDSGQITDQTAADILGCINACDMFNSVKRIDIDLAVSLGLLHMIGEDVDIYYYKEVSSLVMRNELINSKAALLNILYTPLNGSGNLPVRQILKNLGFSSVQVVKEQELPDGDFPTTPLPNPEEMSVYCKAIDLAKQTRPDLIFATDPDCDRIGVLVQNEQGEYSVLSGNQTGALLCEYIIRTKKELGTMPNHAAVLKTIVTTDLGKKICAENGVTIFEVLTGFKYIGEKINEWEKNHTQSFLFGFEESCGYLAGNFVRDKDAIIAAVLIAEMTLYYKEQGRSLLQALDDLYARFGYYAEKLISIAMPGQDGQKTIETLLDTLRSNYQQLFSAEQLKTFEDYHQSTRVDHSTGDREVINLPKSDVLKFTFNDESWVVFRPSKTEPKMKVYLSAVGCSKSDVSKRLLHLEELIQTVLYEITSP